MYAVGTFLERKKIQPHTKTITIIKLVNVTMKEHNENRSTSR